jgi:hypothetical protein
LDFTIRIGDLAEEQGHHPDIYLAWGKVRLTVWTHKISNGGGRLFLINRSDAGPRHDNACQNPRGEWRRRADRIHGRAAGGTDP